MLDPRDSAPQGVKKLTESSSTEQRSPRLTRGEYWLLESAVDVRLPLGLLLRSDLEEAMNKPGHGLSEKELERTLLGLYRRKWIEIKPTGRNEIKPTGRNEIKPTGRKLARMTRSLLKGALYASDDPLALQRGYFYGLTGDGGRAWESFARPAWDKYVDLESAFDDKARRWTHSIAAASSSRVHEAMDVLFGPGAEISCIGKESVRPWQATYWKELPAGVKISLAESESVFEERSRERRLLRDLVPWYWP